VAADTLVVSIGMSLTVFVTVDQVVLSAVEHPRKWPAKRQLTLLDHMLGCLGLRKFQLALMSATPEAAIAVGRP
jgi:hypothetical protein